MNREKPTLEIPVKLLRTIGQSDEMLRQQQTDRSRALSRTALYLANDEEKFSRLQRHQFNVIAALPAYVKAVEYLKEDSYFNPSHKLEDKRAAVEYNHALREMIDDNQHLTMTEVTDFIQKTTLQLSDSPSKVASVTESTRNILSGMRHEIAAENTFWQVQDVDDVRQATDEEDLHGIDLVVTYHGNEYGFDIKASLKAADQANENEHRLAPAMASGFEWEDFGPHMRPTNEATERNIAYYEEMLHWCEANGGYLQKAV